MPSQRRSFPLFKTLLLSTVLGGSNVHADPPSLTNPGAGGEAFPSGVYVYSLLNTTWDSVTMRSHLRYLADQGFNTIYINSLKLTDRTDINILDIAKDYNLRVVYQIDGAFFPNTDYSTAATAIDNARNSAGGSSLLGFSVGEEIAAADVSSLFSYYGNITSHTNPQTVPFYLLHKNPDAIASVLSNYDSSPLLPVITGADRYFLAWTFCSGSGYITTPKYALQRLMTGDLSIPTFVAQTDFDKQRYFSVITGNTMRQSQTIAELEAGAGCPDTTSWPSANVDRWKALAADGNQGLSYDPSDNQTIDYWTFYRPPQNTMRAQAWVSVAAGAQGVLAWSASPDSALAHRADQTIADMFDSVGVPHRSVGELAEVARDLKPFGWIINRMRRNATNDNLVTPTLPTIADTALANTAPPAASNILARTFTLTGVTGHIVVLVNQNVGLWGSDSPNLLWNTLNGGSSTENFHIDTSGELIATDYTPAKPLRINLTTSGGTIFDLQTGQELTDHNSDSTVDIDLKGGAGRLLFVGTQTDLDALRAQAGISTTYAIAGRALLTPDQRAQTETRVVIPAQPWNYAAGYALDYVALEQGKRYRFDATVTTDTATFGAIVQYYDSGMVWQAQQTIGIWNVASTSPSVPKQFTSSEFLTNTAYPNVRLYLYRIGGSGSISVKDAWLQKLDDETRVTSETIAKILPDPTKTYRVEANVRAAPGETSTVGIKWYNCYDSNGGCTSRDGGHDLALSPTQTTATLTTTNQLFQPASFKSTDPTATGVQVVIYRANYSAVPGNTLVIERASAWAVD